MTTLDDKHRKPLTGWRILVPRGGSWGDGVAASLRAQGAVPVIAPLIDFAPAADENALDVALGELAEGRFDWLSVTSATTVDVLFAHQVVVPPSTRIAAVGVTTAQALTAAGYEVALVPDQDNSATDLAARIIAEEGMPRRILSLRGEHSKPLLADRLREAGHDVRSIVAYRTVGVPVSDRVQQDVRSGRVNAILVTSASVAQQVREQFPDIPAATLLVAIGSQTAQDAAQVGLMVSETPDVHDVDALISNVSQFTLPHAADEFAPWTGVHQLPPREEQR